MLAYVFLCTLCGLKILMCPHVSYVVQNSYVSYVPRMWFKKQVVSGLMHLRI
jgi:hypothetical protein